MARAPARAAAAAAAPAPATPAAPAAPAAAPAPVAAPASVAVATPPAPAPGAAPTHRNTPVSTLVLFGTFVTGMYFLILVTTVVGAHTGLIPLRAYQEIARYWGFVLGIYVVFDMIPLLGIFALHDREFKIDRYTLWLVPIAIILLYIWLSNIRELSSDDQIILMLSGIGVVVDAMVIFVAVRLRKEYRNRTP